MHYVNRVSFLSAAAVVLSLVSMLVKYTSHKKLNLNFVWCGVRDLGNVCDHRNF